MPYERPFGFVLMERVMLFFQRNYRSSTRDWGFSIPEAPFDNGHTTAVARFPASTESCRCVVVIVSTLKNSGTIHEGFWGSQNHLNLQLKIFSS